MWVMEEAHSVLHINDVFMQSHLGKKSQAGSVEFAEYFSGLHS